MHRGDTLQIVTYSAEILLAAVFTGEAEKRQVSPPLSVATKLRMEPYLA